ncbi:cobaltochelatase CobT-related protein [Entomobacter blattae]|uniref:Aerobic cobaltochelatase subunit CobT n=1 Tax=Entomobacter blattae TaxID=2762277 RepID=A0A7H1NTP6_9PROT|nr:cobaltochelatase subunit CobT [Entomobacter blattae]QNT79156.1 Aerobic cobaltochelatase subunit CobT [Entomobacter blattae]
MPDAPDQTPPELSSLKLNEKKTEDFKRATVNTLRAMGKKPGVPAENLQVHFQNRISAQQKKDRTHIRLPFPIRPPQQEEITATRAAADTVALQLRYHDSTLHSHHQPAHKEAREVYDALEQMRIEALGSQYMEGVAANLDAKLNTEMNQKGYTRLNPTDLLPSAVALALLARQKFTKRPAPPQIQELLTAWEKTQLTPDVEKMINELANTLTDQSHYNQLTQKILKAYHLIEDEISPDHNNDESDNKSEQTASSESSSLPSPENQPEDQEQSSSEETTDLQAQLQQISSQDQSETSELQVGEAEGNDQPAGSSTDPDETRGNTPTTEQAPYRIYTQQFDEIAPAEELCDLNELILLRQQLDQQLLSMQGIVGRLANRLQRKLLAKQTRSWKFNQEEGLLDTSRLSRIIANPMLGLSYKQEAETAFRDTVVSLLIDNSGSMRGRPIAVAAMCGDLLSRTLERCAVKVEVLGFTTRAWKGGQSRQLWTENGKPSHPGRLNDLRHIIYKDADQPWRRARRNLGLMLKEGLLKENIDGESLLWAMNRLKKRPEKRKILMVISDGAPVDDSTLAVNPPDYLEQHLRYVIDLIENSSFIELLAIGIGHDVTRYYSRAVRITDAEELGSTLLGELTALFEEKFTH